MDVNPILNVLESSDILYATHLHSLHYPLVIPVVPARGGAEVALGLIIRPFHL